MVIEIGHQLSQSGAFAGTPNLQVSQYEKIVQTYMWQGLRKTQYNILGYKKAPEKGLIGGQGRNRTGVDGFAGRSITTLPPGLGKSPSICSAARYSTTRRVTMLRVKLSKSRNLNTANKKPGGGLVPRRVFKFGAGNETRTRDPDLGKVVLYQLSYSRLVLLLTPL